MDIREITEALGILSNYSASLDIEVIHESFPNGAPNHSNKTYFCVEVERDVEPEDAKKLIALKFRPEQDGWFWCRYN